MKVVVIGNCTLDLFFRVPRFPKAGETLLASERMVDVGGKGANQAVVVARCGVEVEFLAALGRDADGTKIRERLAAESVGLDYLLDTDEATDQSIIYVTPDGENSIVSSHGAAAALVPADAESLLASLSANDVMLLQGNLSLALTRHCLERAKERRACTVLNPAPIQYPYDALWSLVDYALPNEVEVGALTGSDALAGARALLAEGAGTVVVTLGARGALLIEQRGQRTGQHITEFPAPQIAAIDTAGAGDVFCGTVAAGLARGLTTSRAVRAAVRAASLSVTRRGTQTSFPTVAELAKSFTLATTNNSHGGG